MLLLHSGSHKWDFGKSQIVVNWKVKEAERNFKNLKSSSFHSLCLKLKFCLDYQDRLDYLSPVCRYGAAQENWSESWCRNSAELFMLQLDGWTQFGQLTGSHWSFGIISLLFLTFWFTKQKLSYRSSQVIQQHRRGRKQRHKGNT